MLPKVSVDRINAISGPLVCNNGIGGGRNLDSRQPFGYVPNLCNLCTCRVLNRVPWLKSRIKTFQVTVRLILHDTMKPGLKPGDFGEFTDMQKCGNKCFLYDILRNNLILGYCRRPSETLAR